VGKFHAELTRSKIGSGGEGWQKPVLKSLSPSRLEIKNGKFRSPTVSDGCRWSRRPTERGGH